MDVMTAMAAAPNQTTLEGIDEATVATWEQNESEDPAEIKAIRDQVGHHLKDLADYLSAFNQTHGIPNGKDKDKRVEVIANLPEEVLSQHNAYLQRLHRCEGLAKNLNRRREALKSK